MFKDIQITLYDIFGYFLPGSVVFLAITVSIWALFWPHEPLYVPTMLPALVVTALLFAAYLAGHLIQAIGNALEKWFTTRHLDKTLPVAPELETMIREAAVTRFGEGAGKLPAAELFDLCDQALLHSGSLGEREIFVYREGFYRGNSIALAAFTIAIALRLASTPTVLVFNGGLFHLYRPVMLFIGALTAVGAWFAYRRYIRFGKYKYRSCFLRFLSLTAGLSKAQQG